MNISACLSTLVLLFALVSCGSDSGTAASNASSTNPSSSGLITANSSSSATLQSNCQLAQGLPLWNGSSTLIWQENVGNSCFASTSTPVASITNYESALTNASWNSPSGWIVAGSMSTNSYTKAKNLDSSYTLLITGDATTSTYTFTLTLKATVYAAPIDRAIASLPPWNGSSKLVWGSGGNSNITVSTQISSQEITNYSALLVADGWVSVDTPFTEEISRYEKTIDGVVYTFAFKKESNGLIYLHLMDLY